MIIRRILENAVLLLVACVIGSSLSHADSLSGAATPVTGSTSSASEGLSKSNDGSQVYDQLIALSAGPFTPQSAVISNGTYSFNYGNGTTSSFLVEAGWAIRLVSGFYLSENLAYSRFSGTPGVNIATGSSNSLSVNLIGLDSRINYSVERFPVRWIIPFAEAGYQYTFYSQTGSSDLDSVQGGTGNFVAGAGVRLWVNRSSALSTDLKGTYRTLPIFVTFKWNDILPNGSNMDLADSNLLVGVSVGL